MSKLLIEKKLINNVPLNEYHILGVDSKGLVFIQHGFESNKNRGTDYLSINLARLGFFVVAIDAYKHGDRKQEPFLTKAEYLRYADAFNVVNITGNDIISLYEKEYQESFDSFDIIGISMGGFVAYSVAVKCDYVNKLVPAITTPYFTRLANTRTNVPGLEEYKKEVSKIMSFIQGLDPSRQVDEMTYNKMLILSCTADDVIPSSHAQQFYKEIKNEKARISLYNDGHVINRKMQNDILEFIANEKVEL